MDNAHPITQFLLKYEFWIRGIILGLILCLMLHTGFLALSEGSLDISKRTYFAFLVLGALSPSIGQIAAEPIWHKITPVKDRATYLENEIVFVASALIGVSSALFFWFQIPILTAMVITIWALMAAAPLYFLIWLIKAILDPLDEHDTSSQAIAVQNSREQTPHFWHNAFAYILTAIVGALVLTVTLYLIMFTRGGNIDFGTGCLSIFSMTLMNLIAAPIFIIIGKKIRPRDDEAKGLDYTIGGIAFLTLIVCINIPVILKLVTGPEQILNAHSLLSAWPYAVSYILISLSFMAGGYTLSKFYKPRLPVLEFA